MDEKRHSVVVASPVTLTPCSPTPVTLTNTCPGRLIIEPKSLRACSASSQEESGIIEVASGQPFYVLLTNYSDKLALVQKPMIIALTVKRPQLTAPTEIIFVESESETVAAMHFKP